MYDGPGFLLQALKVSLQDMSESSAGLVVNLMANDVNRFDTGPIFAHYLWIGPLETMVWHSLYLFFEYTCTYKQSGMLTYLPISFRIKYYYYS